MLFGVETCWSFMVNWLDILNANKLYVFNDTWLRRLIPDSSPGFLAVLLLGWLPAFLQPCLVPHLRPLSASQQRSGTEFLQSSGYPHQLRWRATLHRTGWRICGRAFSTDGTQLGITMDLGRVWFRYQRTLLITMMMFKLGKTQPFKHQGFQQNCCHQVNKSTRKCFGIILISYAKTVVRWDINITTLDVES